METTCEGNILFACFIQMIAWSLNEDEIRVQDNSSTSQCLSPSNVLTIFLRNRHARLEPIDQVDVNCSLLVPPIPVVHIRCFQPTQ
jgi:hypothetical protein